jgi:adenine-specific DNA-methyltransferase
LTEILDNNIGYIGSKLSLINFIYNIINENVPNLHDKIFCDIFSGTNIVSIFFKNKVKKLITNDIEYYSYCIAKSYLSNDIINQNKINILNNLNPIKGNIFNYYSENGKYNRLYFSEYNGKKIDAIRTYLNQIKNDISEIEYLTLLTSLLKSVDKISNTASVYASYLKKLKKTANNKINLKPINKFIVNNQINDIYNEDALILIKKIKGDILYIDPPYNQRQYGSNYHILNAISKYDFNIKPKGITGLMEYNKSKFSSKLNVYNSFNDLIKFAEFNHIFISYNNEGIMNKKSILKILSNYGNVKIYEKKYKTFKADNNRKNKSINTIEYIFYLKKF